MVATELGTTEAQMKQISFRDQVASLMGHIEAYLVHIKSALALGNLSYILLLRTFTDTMRSKVSQVSIHPAISPPPPPLTTPLKN